MTAILSALLILLGYSSAIQPSGPVAQPDGGGIPTTPPPNGPPASV